MSNTKIRNKHGWGAPENGSLQAAEVAVDLNGKNSYSTATDGGSVFKMVKMIIPLLITIMIMVCAVSP